MITQLSSTTPKARKKHWCSACEHINADDPSYYIDEMTFAEKRAYVRMRKNKFRIAKGDKYDRQTGIFDDEFYTWKGDIVLSSFLSRIDAFSDIF